MAYILQTDGYRCGPVAIINADVWKNGSSSIDIEKLSQGCGTNEVRGTERWDLNLKDILGISQKPTYKISTIGEELEIGNSAIILYSFREWDNSVGAHYIFVEKVGGELLVHNSFGEDESADYQNKCYQDWEVLHEELLRCNPNDEMGLFYPCAWIVRNEN